jgi:hypothetical protein
MSICEVSQFNRVGIIRIIETRNEHTQRKGYVRTQQYGHLQAKERGLRRKSTCLHLNLGLLFSRTVKKINVYCLPRKCAGIFLWQP